MITPETISDMRPAMLRFEGETQRRRQASMAPVGTDVYESAPLKGRRKGKTKKTKRG